MRISELARSTPRGALLQPFNLREILIEQQCRGSLERSDGPTLFAEGPSRPSSPGIVAGLPKRSGRPALHNTPRPLPDRRTTLPHARLRNEIMDHARMIRYFGIELFENSGASKLVCEGLIGRRPQRRQGVGVKYLG